MNQDQWTAVDRYITDTLVPADPGLEQALVASNAAGLPAIQVSVAQGQLLRLLAEIQQSRTILEVGTLGGYSTICLARALPPDGRLVTLELDPKHAEVARENFRRARVADVIDLRIGPAAASLAQLVAEKRGPFDFIFIDADKAGYPEYFSWAMRLSRRGTVIVADNVVRKGEVIDPASKDASVQGVRRFNERVAAEARVRATAIQTVGSKGYDGFALLHVVADGLVR
jgi:predicted O-methyltransferase YrrM